MLTPSSSRRARLGRRGVAAIEFALAAPVLMLLVIGVIDVARGIIMWEEIYEASRNIPVSASSLSVQADKTTLLSPTQVQQTLSTIYAEAPWLRDLTETSPTKSVTLSSVAFVPVAGCQPSALTNCYVPYVAWSTSYAGGNGQTANPFQQVRRPCGVLLQKGPTDPILAAQLLLTVRTLGISEPDPVLVADVHYQYRPLFLKFLTGPLDFWATGYWSVRSVDPTKNQTQQFTQYVPADPAVNCTAPPLSY